MATIRTSSDQSTNCQANTLKDDINVGSRTVLPVLRNFTFSGRCKYFEEFISRIDTPQLISIIVYYESGNGFDVLQLSRFIDRSKSLKQSLSRHCKILLSEHDLVFITITFCVGRTTSPRWDLKPGISVRLSGRIISALGQHTWIHDSSALPRCSLYHPFCAVSILSESLV